MNREEAASLFAFRERGRAAAEAAYKRFAKQNLEIGGIDFRQFEMNPGAPCGVSRMGERDIILSGCLINYYAQ